MKPIYWTSNDSRCEICGVEFPGGILEAEMWDPEQPEDTSIICHFRCGLKEGLTDVRSPDQR